MSQSNDYGVSDILSSELKSNQVRVQLGEATTGSGEAPTCPVYGIEGFYSMPNPPAKSGEQKGAAQAFWVRNGDFRIVVASRDNRWISAYGSLAEGDRMIASDCDAILGIKKANSAVIAYTKNQADNDSDMVWDFNGKEGRITFLNGRAIINISHDKITAAVGVTAIELNEDGFFVNGQHCGLNTAGGNLGTIVADVPPVVGAQSILYGPVGTSGVASTKWTIGG